MIIVNYGRIGMYDAAGTVIECRYCVHLGERLPDRDDYARCIEHKKPTPLRSRCTSFWREVGTDDA